MRRIDLYLAKHSGNQLSPAPGPMRQLQIVDIRALSVGGVHDSGAGRDNSLAFWSWLGSTAGNRADDDSAVDNDDRRRYTVDSRCDRTAADVAGSRHEPVSPAARGEHAVYRAVRRHSWRYGGLSVAVERLLAL